MTTALCPFCIDNDLLRVKVLYEDDRIELYIPQRLSGRLEMFGANLSVGEVIIYGDLGNFAGYRMHGIANLRVNGSVGDFAAMEMAGLASMHVTGNAGEQLCYGATNGTVDIDGTVDSLELRPSFTGYVTANRVLDTTRISTLPDTYSITYQG